MQFYNAIMIKLNMFLRFTGLSCFAGTAGALMFSLQELQTEQFTACFVNMYMETFHMGKQTLLSGLFWLNYKSKCLE